MNTIALVYLSIKHDLEPRFLYGGTVLVDIVLLLVIESLYLNHIYA